MRQIGLDPMDAAEVAEAAGRVFAAKNGVAEAEKALEALVYRLYRQGKGSTAALGEAAGRSKSWAHLVVSRPRRTRR